MKYPEKSYGLGKQEVGDEQGVTIHQYLKRLLDVTGRIDRIRMDCPKGEDNP